MEDEVKSIDNKYLPLKSAAYYLGISPKSLRDFEYRGVVPGSRLGRSVRFNIDELDEYLIKNRIHTLDEIGEGAPIIPPGRIGPLVNPEEAAEYLGLPSARAVMQRLHRMQIPAYKIGERVFRFRKCELDNCLLTNDAIHTTVDHSACLPELGRR